MDNMLKLLLIHEGNWNIYLFIFYLITFLWIIDQQGG